MLGKTNTHTLNTPSRKHKTNKQTKNSEIIKKKDTLILLDDNVVITFTFSSQFDFRHHTLKFFLKLLFTLFYKLVVFHKDSGFCLGFYNLNLDKNVALITTDTIKILY